MMALARCERCQIDMRRATGDWKQEEQAELCRTGASIHWLLGGLFTVAPAIGSRRSRWRDGY